MADQIERAAASLVANLGEAFDADTLAEKRRYFRYALGSTGEGARLLHGASQAKALPESALDEAFRLLRDIKWDLIRLVRWTQR
jgi:four helix bundle protein